MKAAESGNEAPSLNYVPLLKGPLARSMRELERVVFSTNRNIGREKGACVPQTIEFLVCYVCDDLTTLQGEHQPGGFFRCFICIQSFHRSQFVPSVCFYVLVSSIRVDCIYIFDGVK